MLVSPIRIPLLRPLTLTLAALAATPSPGMIMQGEASETQDEQVLAAAHELAKQHPSSVCVMLKANHWAPHAWHSGVWVGSGKGGRYGYILTAAHSYFAKATDTDPARYLDSFVFFGATPQDALRARISRVIIHPGRKPSVRQDGGRIQPGENDLALLEFPLDGIGESLERRGIKPALVPEGPEASKLENAEVRVVGAGPFSTSTSLKVDYRPFRLHGGHTRVTHGTFGEQTGLFSWSFVSTGEHPGRPGPGAQGGDLISVPFVHTREPVTVQDPEDGSRFRIQSATGSQARPNPGDSGGPLFLEGKDGTWRLQGIHSRSNLIPVALPEYPEERFSCHWSFWEPLRAETLLWLEDVREGRTDGSLTVTYERGWQDAFLEMLLVNSVLGLPAEGEPPSPEPARGDGSKDEADPVDLRKAPPVRQEQVESKAAPKLPPGVPPRPRPGVRIQRT